MRLGNEWEVARVSRRTMLDGSAATFVDGVGGCAVLPHDKVTIEWGPYLGKEPGEGPSAAQEIRRQGERLRGLGFAAMLERARGPLGDFLRETVHPALVQDGVDVAGSGVKPDEPVTAATLDQRIADLRSENERLRAEIEEAQHAAWERDGLRDDT